jgi:hypothetical protein
MQSRVATDVLARAVPPSRCGRSSYRSRINLWSRPGWAVCSVCHRFWRPDDVAQFRGTHKVARFDGPGSQYPAVPCRLNDAHDINNLLINSPTPVGSLHTFQHPEPQDRAMGQRSPVFLSLTTSMDRLLGHRQ